MAFVSCRTKEEKCFQCNRHFETSNEKAHEKSIKNWSRILRMDKITAFKWNDWERLKNINSNIAEMFERR